MILAIVVFVLFYVLPALWFWLVAQMKAELTGKTQLKKLKDNPEDLTLKEKISKWRNYSFKRSDKKILSIILYLGFPLINALLSWFLYGIVWGILLDIVLYIIYVVIINKLIAEQYNKEQKLIRNLIDLKRANMSPLINKNSNVFNYQEEFVIEEWDQEDPVKPTKIKMFAPITFTSDKRKKFTGDFTNALSFNGVWVDEWEDGQNIVTLTWKEFLGDTERQWVDSFLQFKKQAMGLVNNQTTLFTYQTEFDVVTWGPDRQPEKIRLFLPVGYDQLQMSQFLEGMSNGFGRGRPWELDNADPDFPGLDMDKRIATIALQAPLPGKAIWTDYWLNNDIVQWSFFPLGLGSKGGLPIPDPETGEEVRLVGFDVNGAQQKYCAKQNIYTGPDIMPSPHAILCGVTGGGKSVMQRNVILSCLMRPKHWLLFIVDMKKVEGAMWRKYGVPVATTYEDAAALCNYAQVTMMERFEEMEKRGINNWADMPEDLRGPAIMVNVDEIAELLAPIKGKSDEDKINADYQAQCQTALESIARLGRAAQVHMIVAGQRPDSEVVSMQIRQNCPTRLAAGAVPATISQMVFESSYAATIPPQPKGRCAIRVHSDSPFKFQGFFADEEWFDKYLEEHNLPTNVYEGALMAEQYYNNQAEMQAQDAMEAQMTEAEYEELMRAIGN
jgi:Ftsk/SpoIIIE family protein